MSEAVRGTPRFPSRSAEGRARLPSGRHALAPEYVAAHQRARLLAAICELCAERGYDAVTVADVVRAAAVSQRTFYRNFSSRQECFLAAFAQAAGEIEATVLPAIQATDSVAGETRPPWPLRAAAALRAALEALAAHRVLASTLFVDALFAGPEALEHRERLLDRCRAELPVPAGAPPEVAEAALGGVVETIYHAVLAGEVGALPAMGGELVYCLLVQLVGDERAREVVAETYLCERGV